MSIQVSCSNGHALRVKDSFAGKTGYCPHCRAKVHVPQPLGFSEDDVISVLGPPPPMPPDEPESASETEVHQSPRHRKSEAESGLSLAGSSILRRAKLCPSCHNRTSFSFSICPTCGTPLPSAGLSPTVAPDGFVAEAGLRDHETSSPAAPRDAGASDESSSALTKSCIKCSREIDAGTRICPHCHTYIGGLSDLQGPRF